MIAQGSIRVGPTRAFVTLVVESGVFREPERVLGSRASAATVVGPTVVISPSASFFARTRDEPTVVPFLETIQAPSDASVPTHLAPSHSFDVSVSFSRSAALQQTDADIDMSRAFLGTQFWVVQPKRAPVMAIAAGVVVGLLAALLTFCLLGGSAGAGAPNTRTSRRRKRRTRRRNERRNATAAARRTSRPRRSSSGRSSRLCRRTSGTTGPRPSTPSRPRRPPMPLEPTVDVEEPIVEEEPGDVETPGAGGGQP